MFKKGEVSGMEIQHDSWCKTLKTGSGMDCNCDPDIHSENKELADIIKNALDKKEFK